MPFFSFNVIKKEDINKIIFIDNNPRTCFITIDWNSRPNKQEKLVKHIFNFFKKDYPNIFVKFIELDNYLYLNGEKA